MDDVKVSSPLRRSLMLCSDGGTGVREAAPEDGTAAAGMRIGGPADVRHVSHITFDRFVGFLDLPADLEPDVPCPIPSTRSFCMFIPIPRRTPTICSLKCSSYGDAAASRPLDTPHNTIANSERVPGLG